MNKAEIANIFIKAAYIDSRLPDSARPKRLKASWVPFFHSEDEIKERRVTGHPKESLHPGDNPLNEWRHEFWQNMENRISRNDISLWENANELTKLVSDEANRRALWAWAMAKVGTLRVNETVTRDAAKGLGKLTAHKRTRNDASFTAWCKSEGIHEMTGSRRKDRAIAVIEQHLVRAGLSNVQTGDFTLLPVGPVFEHISDNIAADASKDEGPTFERDRDTVFAKEAALFDWQEIRNDRRRRQREVKKREAV